MAPKTPVKFYSDSWYRCNICGLLVKHAKRQAGQPDVDHVYAKTLSCTAHHHKTRPSIADLVRMEDEMDVYAEVIKKRPAARWNPNVEVRRFIVPERNPQSNREYVDPAVENTRATASEPETHQQRVVSRQRQAAILKKPAAPKRR